MDAHYCSLYELYREIRAELIVIFDQMSMDHFREGFHISQTELRMVTGVENMMDLSCLFHDALLCRNHSIVQSAYHILDRGALTDDSPKEEVCIYFNAHLIITLFESLTLFEDFIQKLISLSEYYRSYIQGDMKDFFEYVIMEEMMEGMRLS